jgi:hypothetical protein
LPATFTLPPASRAVGTGNPPVDMNGVILAHLATGAAYNVCSTAWAGGADSTGVADSTAAINAAVAAAITDGRPVYIPGGTYKISSALNWKAAGLVVTGDGPKTTIISQVTDNTPVVMVAGQQQRISGLRLGYANQQINTSTSAICLQFGDDSVGNCFTSHFTDLQLYQGAYGMRINPALTASSGMFSCEFENIRVLGWSISAIALEAAAATGFSNCTGCVFSNIYLHNNNTGSPANSLLAPVFIHSWDEISFNQLNVEHSNVFNTDVIQLQQVGNALFNSLHLEALQLSGASGNSGYFSIGSNSSVTVTGMSVRFSTLTGSSNNPVARFFGGTSKLTLTGYNEATDVTVGGAGVHPWVNFSGNTNCAAAISGIAQSQVNGTSLNVGSGCVLLTGLQFYDGTFGDGSDGAVVLDGSTTFNNFSSLAGSTYTLTRDVFATNLTVNNTVTLKPAGFRIFCNGGFTNNGTVNCDGNAGAGTANGGTTGNGTILGGRPGGTGGATGVNNGTNGTGDGSGGVGAAGAGGAGTSGGTGGTGGTSVLTGSAWTTSVYKIPFYAQTGYAPFTPSSAAAALCGGAGGGGGGGGSTGNGGGGGSGGGLIVIFAWSAVNGGTITAKGGNGGNATGNGGAGGPGSGGKIFVYSLSAWTPGTATVTAGSAGTGAGSPGTGAAGLVLNVVIA